MRLYIALILCLSAVACAKPDERTYPLQGQVLSLEPERKQLTVKHEEIKGFMPAMTMPYEVEDAKAIDALAPGDLINSSLVVFSNGAHLTEIRKVGTAPLEKPPADVPNPPASAGFELIRPGESIPDAKFVDQDGKARRFGAFKGSPVVMTFIYTKCPLPTFCPLMDRHFATIQQKLKDDPALKGRVHLVSVSFDPIVDTPPVLRAHAKTLGADLKTWTFLTGDRDDIDRFAARFGVSVARSQTDQRDITHNLRTALVDADGKLVKVYIGNEWTPDQALADVKPVVGAN